MSLFIAGTKNANGQAFGPDGRLYAAATGSGQILAYDAEAKPAVVADGIRANDLVVRHDGGIYVTQPGGGGSPSQVWYINPLGEKRVVDTGLKFANGITLSPDQSVQTLFATCSDRVYKRKVKVKEANAYEPPIKPQAPRL